MAQLSEKRKRKPKILAWINDSCTGCAGSPVCQDLCPVEDCMVYVPNEDTPNFMRIWVDPLKCIGCKKCTSKGPMGAYLEGCPWNAIDLIDLGEYEKSYGELPF